MRTKLILAALFGYVACRTFGYGGPADASDRFPAFSTAHMPGAPELRNDVAEGRLVAVGDIVIGSVRVNAHGMEASRVTGAVATLVASGTPVRTFFASSPNRAEAIQSIEKRSLGRSSHGAPSLSGERRRVE